MANIARLKKDGTLLLKDSISERLPLVQNGLVAHYPLDSRAGCIDIIRGAGTVNNSESNMNIADAMITNWRDPNNWSGNYATWDIVEQALTSNTASNGSYMSAFISIDTSKSYYLEADVKSLNGTGSNLYFGYRFYDADFNEIGTSSHYGAFDYTGASSFLVPTTWTHIRNSGCGGAPKTGEGNSGTTVFHTGTKYVTLLILWNYSSTADRTWIKNIRLSTSNSDTSNLIFSEEGVAVQEGTTSMCGQPYAQFSNWAGFTGTSTYFIAPNGHKGIFLNAITGGGCEWKRIDQITVSPSTVYTVSSKIKPSNLGAVSVNFFYIREYYGLGSGQIREYGIFNPNNIRKLDNGYLYTWASFTTDSSCNAVIIQGYEYGGNQTIACYDFQLERHTYPSTLVSGTTSAGKLQIPLPVKAFPFTVSVIVKNQMRNGINGEDGEITKGYPISWWETSGGYKGILGQFNRTTSFFNLDSFRATCIVRATHYDLYFNDTAMGLNVLYQNDTVAPFTTPFSFGTRNNEESVGRFNGIYSNASFWNRALSISEIRTLMNDGMKMSANTLSTPWVVEQPLVPSDAWYFPLSSHLYNSTMTISPTSSSNIVFDNSSAWVGTSVTNMISNTNMFTWDRNGSGQGAIGSCKSVNGNGILIDDKSSNTRLNAGYINISPNTNYTISVDLLRLSNTPTFRWQLQAYNAASEYLGTIWTQSLGNYTRDIGGWQNVYNTFSFPYSTTAKVFTWFQDGEDYVTYTHSYILKNPMMSNKSFYVPFTANSRGASSLTYNLNASIGLDWSSEWTICYWKKPSGTFADNLTGYNIESLGCNSNSVGGDYTWWGKNNGSDSIAGSNYGFNPSDYFNKWQFVFLRKTGTILQYKIFFDNGETTTWTKTGPTVSNAYVTQYGYDLKLGGWDNDNPTNTFFRDLVVLKRSASDTEIMDIYKQLSIYRNKIYDKNTIEIAL